MSLFETAITGVRAGRPPHLSIKAGAFTACDGGSAVSCISGIMDGKPYCEFILVGASSAKAKILYAETKYDPSDPQPPLCMSLNGKVPGSGTQTAQARSCGACPHNVWMGQTPPPCRDYKLLAVIVPTFSWATTLQFYLPPASFKAWGSFIDSVRAAKDSTGAPISPENLLIRMFFVDTGVLGFAPGATPWVSQVYGPDAVSFCAAKIVDPAVAMLLTDSPLPDNLLPAPPPAALLPAPEITSAAPAPAPAPAFAPAPAPAPAFAPAPAPAPAFAPAPAPAPAFAPAPAPAPAFAPAPAPAPAFAPAPAPAPASEAKKRGRPPKAQADAPALAAHGMASVDDTPPDLEMLNRLRSV